MRTHQHARQGEASHKEVHRDSGPARGPVSPLGGSGGPAETVLHRDEDIASAPMERLPKGSVPQVNQRAGLTSIRGRHGPRGSPDEAA
jgi:hypothetical protein